MDAIKGNITEEMISIAEIEKFDVNDIMKKVSKGEIVIMKRADQNPVGIGFPLRTKINVNLGSSSITSNMEKELEKVKIAQKYGADTISDLSMGDNIDEIRKKNLSDSTVPITTVPIYQAVIEANSLSNISDDLIFSIIEKQIRDGISSIVIHAGFTLEILNKMKKKE